MAFDSATRNRLAHFVADARGLIAEEFTQQFQSLYGISPKGDCTPLEKLPHLDEMQLATAALLRERIQYLIKSHPDDKGGAQAAVERLAREQAFTVLNRFAAIRMAEKRGIIVESIGKSYQSKGFKVYETVAGSGLGEAYHRYQRYLFCLFDELAVDLGVLFDRRSPHALLFPREQALLALLELINDPEIEPLWAEDETVGWIYQYYNDPLERKKMREQSSAPRNSRELAVRNQFFTPRYVVEFLTDNTLGRIWYEMTKGQTRLKDQCRYLVRRPTEVFLGPEESAPAVSSKEASENLSQEELLRQPVYIAHRPLKDPRSILMLDPACGSMHFGLYAFDLFEVIYEEFWDLVERMKAEGKSRKEMEATYPEFSSFILHTSDFSSKEEFLRDVPRLIIEHNLHGIDIDPRCAQIAGLSLWLRAQKAWQRLGIQPAERPAIKRSNIVCAEPMPGEKELLREFVEREFPAAERPVCLRLLEAIFDKMQLAGEAGSLLKIEEEIRSAIEDARDAWQKLATKPPELFTTTELNQLSTAPELTGLEQAVSSLTTDPRHLTTDFWERIEERIYAALRDYAEQAENGGGFQRRLFAEDAARGFAFIDVCRKRYNVALMNPPFGDAAEGSKDYIFNQHTREKTELGACFVTRISRLLVTNGSLGIISNRTFLFAESFQEWRALNLQNLSLCADLGFGVLDALVETAAFVLSVQSSQVASFVALTNSPDKGVDLSLTVREVSNPETNNHRLFERHKSTFSDLGTEWFYYWLSERLLTKAKALSAKQTGLLAKPGLQTCDNFRFVRLVWEVPKDSQFQQTWFRLSKGGEYQPFWSDVHLVALWRDDGLEMKQFIENSYESWSKQIPSVNLYFLPGLTYSERTTSSLSLRIFPAGCLFDKQGPFVGYPAGRNQSANLLVFLGISYCYLFKALVESQVGLRDATEAGSPARHYMPSMIERLPLPLIPREEEQIVTWASASIKLHREFAALDTGDSMHRGLQDLGESVSISQFRNKLGKHFTDAMQHLYKGLAFSEVILARAFNITQAQEQKLESVFGPQFALENLNQAQPKPDDIAALLSKSEAELVQETISRVGYFSSILKQSFVANRHVELAAICLAKSPVEVLQQVKSFDWLISIAELSQNLFDFWVGGAFGRWDIRYATGEQAAPELPDPFAALPVCPPGQLQNAQGLPLGKDEVGRMKDEGGWDYPIEIPWDGILVDDPNHPLDLERRVREVIEIIWSGQEGGTKAEAIEHEACEILGVKSLRDYFRKPAGFFADHLKRYSKSRRQAPIYWPLSTASGSYTLWIYYHRLTDQTLHTVLADFLEPKIRNVQAELDAHQAGGNGQKAGESRDFLDELKDLRDEIERIIKLPWKPNLNDGVLITASPLWKLFRLTKWQKDLKACWDDLEAGEYDWAHLTHSIWPQRVEKACETDRSIAIAHGLEHLCKVEPPKPKKKRAKKAAEDESKAEEPKLI